MSMTRAEAQARLREITAGIDRDSTYDDDGWWETSSGVAFGSAKVAELEQLVIDLT